MKMILLILGVVLIYCGTTTMAQDQLSAYDSSRVQSLAVDVYSIQTTITCQGDFYDLNSNESLTTYTFYEYGTACRIDSLLITAYHTIDYHAVLYRFFDYLASARSTGDHNYGLLAHRINEIKIEYSILGYWGAKYIRTDVIDRIWEGYQVTPAKVEKYVSQLEVATTIYTKNGFAVLANDKKLDLALIYINFSQPTGQIKFGQTKDISNDDILIGLAASPYPVPRLFEFNFKTGYLTDREFEFSNPKDALPYPAMVLSMNTRPGNSGEPVVSIPDNKLVGITVMQLKPWTKYDKVSNRRVIIPADLIEDFYHKTMKTFYGE